MTFPKPLVLWKVRNFTMYTDGHRFEWRRRPGDWRVGVYVRRSHTDNVWHIRTDEPSDHHWSTRWYVDVCPLPTLAFVFELGRDGPCIPYEVAA